MKVSIVKSDGLVVKDGLGIDGLSLSGIADDIWAVQWDSSTSKGTVEKTDLSVTEITDFSPYQSALDEFTAAEATAPPPPTAEETLRGERDILLQESDWTVLPDSPLSTSKVNEWKTYRQALRDLPANTSDYANPTYPTEPS